jgi:Putative Flp pilus-assembly TadE/G-like
MRRARYAYRSEEGAVLVQVGLSILVLMVLNVFVIDYGMFWVARTQAQSAADAGALMGVTGMAYDSRVTTPENIRLASEAVAKHSANYVWGDAGGAVASFNCPAGVTGITCVRVEVYRDGTNGSTVIPTIFGKIVDIDSQGVRGSATAVIGAANTITCLKPWALPDEWREFGSATELDQLDSTTAFHAWNPGGVPAPNPDTYTSPNSSQATTATNFSTDYGDIVQFELNYDPLTEPIKRGLMLRLALPGPKTHFENMTSCNGQPIWIGQRLPLDTNPAVDPEAAAQAAYALDGGADWSFDGGIGTGYVVHSCAPGCQPISPRTWAVALYDPSDFEKNRASGWPDCGGTPCILISNIVGVFIDFLDHSQPNGRHGHFVRYPGMVNPTQPTIAENGSWLVEPRLIR